VDRLGRYLAAASFGTSDAANTDLVAWTRRYGQVTTAGVEGTGSYGYRLAQHLADQGIDVVEVNRPDRARRRRKGKSDPVDAEAAARAVLAGDACAVPKDRNGGVGELRALMVARRSAIKARTQATNQIRALLVDGEDELRGRLRPLRKIQLARACAQLAPAAGLRLALGSLGRRWPWTRRSPALTRLSPARSGAPRPGCWSGTASACRPPPNCCSPPATTPTGSTARRRLPPCAASAPSRRPRARPSGTD